MKIGIIGAMRCETEKLKDMMSDSHSEKISGIEFICGRLGAFDAVLATCGIGKVFAAMCAQTMILRFSPDFIINTGVAGTLTEKLSVCDIAVSSDMVQHDMDTSPLGDPVGLISGLNIINIPASRSLCNAVCRAAADCALNAVSGTIASGDSFIADAERKNLIKSRFGAIACEMEGAAIGQVCFVNKVPFVVIRAISDGGDEDAGITYEQFVLKASENSVRLIGRLTEESFLLERP